MLKRIAVLMLVCLLMVTALPAGFAGRNSECSAYPTGHKWSSWKTEKAATCKAEGKQTRSCACGKKEEKKIKKSGHDFGDWKTTKKPTCEKTGEKTRKCKVCGAKKKESIAKKAHSWGAWTVIVEATDRGMGERERSCKNCKTKQKESFYPEGTLKRGDSGDAVRKLQEQLNQRGFDCGKADGSFGKKTEAAVKAFEATIGIDADGIAWPYVIAMLGGQEAIDFTTPQTANRSTRKLTNAPESEREFEKWESSVPLNGWAYYEEGEEVTYSFIIRNNADPEGAYPVMRDVQLWDERVQPDACIAKFESIMPGEMQGLEINYRVTAEDVQNGTILNTAQLYWTDYSMDGATVGPLREMASGNVLVYTRAHFDPTVIVELSIENTPANGAYYQEGETIQYFIRLINTGDEPITNVTVFDPMNEDDDGIVATAAEIAPEGTIEARAAYTVTAEDVKAGEISNVAFASCDSEEFISSEAVIAKTSPERTPHIYTFIDTAYVGEAYNGSFDIGEAIDGSDHVFENLTPVGGNLEEVGLTSEADLGAGARIRVSGTPDRAGVGECVYTIEANGVLWQIEVIIMSEIPGYSLTIEWGDYKDGKTESLGVFEKDSVDYTLPETDLVGYEFTGWHDQNGNPFEPGQPITRDTVLRPEYREVETFEITFDMDVWDPQPPIRVNKGAVNYKLPVPEEKDGYEFIGWCISRSKSNDPKTRANVSVRKFNVGDPIEANLTLWAQSYQTKGFKITFDAGEDGHILGMKAQKTEAMTTPEGKLKYYPRAEGSGRQLNFEGWYNSDGVRVDNDPDYVFKADTVLFASWSSNPTVSFISK